MNLICQPGFRCMNKCCNSRHYRFSFFTSLKALLILLAAAGLQACATDSARVGKDELAIIKTQLAQQQMELAQQQQSLEAMHSAHIHHHAITISAQSETLKSLTTLLNRDSRLPYCAPQPVVAECPDNGGSQARRNAGDKVVVGEIEYVRLHPPGKVFEARIDTGATTSSLSAVDVQKFERDGENWVRFKIPEHNGRDVIEMEEPVARFARIIQSSAEDGERRPVVELQYKLGGVTRVAEFTLSDRSHLDFPVLVGRNVLRDLIIVDVSRKHTTELAEEDHSDEEDNE